MSHYLILIVLTKCLHTIVVCFRTMCVCSYSDQVEDIEHNNASVEGDFDAKMNSFKHIKCFFMKFWYIELYAASFGDDFDAKLN